ncbi:MAG: MBL fold metallo-hydrolase [Alphaproteobacteria bacterium]|nr:MBL fold metallo-hydrolase [Alphaproteobacteria bacterium]
MQIKTFFDPATFTLTYVVFDLETKDAVVIDPVLDFDPASGRVTTTSADEVAAFVEKEGLTLHYVLETHAHADHLSGSQPLKDRFGAKIAIGARIRKVQDVFKGVFNLGDDFVPDGHVFDRLLGDFEVLEAGSLKIEALPTPGHTPACMSFHVGDAVFTGDALFMPDFGVGRCDFPAGSAETLYTSVHDTLYSLPDETRVFVGHDYQPGGRALAWETTIGASKLKNKQLTASTAKEDFVAFREARDATLTAPRLLLPSIQVNINAGKLPAAEDNGVAYLKLPLRPSA